MHVYIYDSFVTEKKYHSTIAKIETRITDLGLNGKIIRLSALNSIYSTIENELKKGAKTIIVAGDNTILNQAINAIAQLNIKNQTHIETPLAFIPIGKKNNNISDFLGITSPSEACDCISARRIKKLDLGLVNNQYFLTQINIPTQGTVIEIDKNYSIEIGETGHIYVLNLPIISNIPKEIKPSAEDNNLELYIKSKKVIKSSQKQQSVFSFKKLKITNKKHPIEIDNTLTIQTPAEVTIAKEKINIILGKKRKF